VARPSLRSLVSIAIPAVLACLFAAACSGGSSEKLVDPSQADALSHQALLTEQDLPGSGWSASKNDVFDDAGPDAKTTACNDINSRKSTAVAKELPQRSGRAERELEQRTEADIPPTVGSEVDIFKDTSAPADSLAAYQDAVKSSNFEACLKDALNASVNDPTAKIDTKSVAALASAPSGGTAVAYEFSFAVQGQTFVLHYESYVWRSANVGVTLTVEGLKESVTADLVKAALDKQAAKVDALPKK
jgi:hypothetical protein